MKPQVTGFILILGLCLGTHIPAAAAACGIERDNVSDSTVFMRHLSRECSQVDRASHAVTAAEIIGAIKAGQGISLKNAVVTGDLLLTRRLPKDELEEMKTETVIVFVHAFGVTGQWQMSTS